MRIDVECEKIVKCSIQMSIDEEIGDEMEQ